MKIGFYTDVHASFTSSIMPVYTSSSIYTMRLSMIIDTFKWMYEEFDKRDIDIICNCGDLFDNHVLRSEEISAMSEAFRWSRGTKEIHIVGNHEVLDTNRKFYSNALLDNFPFIEVFQEPARYKDTELSVLPYMRAEDVTPDLLSDISNKVLISHIDILGSHLRPDYIMDTGVDPELLASNFEYVMNGHIHTAETIETSKNTVMNIGSTTSQSFSDSNTYIPSILILDTNSGHIERIENKNSPIFRRIRVHSISDLINKTKTYSGYKCILRVICPYELRNEAQEYLESLGNVLAYRVVADISKGAVASLRRSERIQFDVGSGIKPEFAKFIKSNSEALSFPVDKYLSIVEEI